MDGCVFSGRLIGGRMRGRRERLKVRVKKDFCHFQIKPNLVT